MFITPIYLVALFIVMTGFQYIYAGRNELDKQKKYIEENIRNTRVLKKRKLNKFILKAITKMQMVKNLVITKELP